MLSVSDDECEQILSHFGITYNDFSGPIRTNLEDFSDLKRETGLAILDLTYLQEWYCLKVEKNIPKKMAIQSVQCDVSDLDYELVRIQQSMKASERWGIENFSEELNSFTGYRLINYTRFIEYVKENTKLTAGIDRVFEEKRCEYNLLLDRKVNIIQSYEKLK